MANDIAFRIIDASYLPQVLPLAKQLNPKRSEQEIVDLLAEMFAYENCKFFGAFMQQELVAVSAAWLTVRVYSGKQLEVDHFVVDQKHHSMGIGGQFLQFISDWARANGCKSVELNTYAQNTRSHKFYYNQGYQILGFHFIKGLE